MCVWKSPTFMCLRPEFDMFWAGKNLAFFLALSIIVKLNAKNDQKVVWSNSHIYVFTSWIWTDFDSFFERKFRTCSTIFQIFSMCNQILVLDHFPHSGAFFKSCVVGGLRKSEIFIKHNTKGKEITFLPSGKRIQSAGCLQNFYNGLRY